jgi:hypothetical protein
MFIEHIAYIGLLLNAQDLGYGVIGYAEHHFGAPAGGAVFLKSVEPMLEVDTVQISRQPIYNCRQSSYYHPVYNFLPIFRYVFQ